MNYLRPASIDYWLRGAAAKHDSVSEEFDGGAGRLGTDGDTGVGGRGTLADFGEQSKLRCLERQSAIK